MFPTLLEPGGRLFEYLSEAIKRWDIESLFGVVCIRMGLNIDVTCYVISNCYLGDVESGMCDQIVSVVCHLS